MFEFNLFIKRAYLFIFIQSLVSNRADTESMFVFRGKAPTRVESPSAELVDSGTSASDLLLQAAGAHSPPSTPHCSVSSPGPLSQTHDQMPDLHELKGDND